MREDEGRKLLKEQWIHTIERVKKLFPAESAEHKKLHSLVQKVRFKKHVLTKEDMQFVNEVFAKTKGSQ